MPHWQYKLGILWERLILDMFGTYSWKIHIKTETIDILCDLMSFANFIKVLGYFNLMGFAYKNKPYIRFLFLHIRLTMKNWVHPTLFFLVILGLFHLFLLFFSTSIINFKFLSVSPCFPSLSAPVSSSYFQPLSFYSFSTSFNISCSYLVSEILSPPFVRLMMHNQNYNTYI